MLIELAEKRTVTLKEALSYKEQYYPTANDMQKIQLKCWIYYCQGRESGGKKSYDFFNYTHKVSELDYLLYIKSMVIDCHDIGGHSKAIQTIRDYFSGKEGER